jgi:hypothetical protein
MFIKPFFQFKMIKVPLNIVAGFFFSFFRLKTQDIARKKKTEKKNKLYKRRATFVCQFLHIFFNFWSYFASFYDWFDSFNFTF